MSDKTLILTIAKVIITAAWADGELSRKELNSLKDLLFQLSHPGRGQEAPMTQREWASLEMYMETPVDEAERARLLKQLQNALRTSKDRQLALSALEDLIHADGQVTEAEQAVAAEIRTALEAVDLSLIGQLGRLIRGTLTRASGREKDLDEFIQNKVYYALRQRLDLGEAEFNIPGAELRKYSLAGGLMARVAHVDREVTKTEREAIVAALQEGWQVTPQAAAFITEVAVSAVSATMDYFRLVREFFNSTTLNERLHFLEVLFAVAAADGQVSHAETEEIRHIAKGLNMTHKQFIEAKLKVIRH
jgi:uncharacterized tellurite resistance protein B-like protein